MRPRPSSPRRHAVFAAALVAAGAVGLAACSNDGRDLRPPRPDQFPATTVREPATTTSIEVDTLPGEGADDELEGSPDGFVLSGPWPRGGTIDARHTCDGDDRSPSLRWFGAPAGTVALALVVTDLDANGFVHWVLANVDATQVVLVEGAAPPGAAQATNDFGVVGWSGPCPPEGEAHRYRFELHALDQQIELADGEPAADALTRLGPASIAVAVYEGTYAKS